jgi:hypothetical protein
LERTDQKEGAPVEQEQAKWRRARGGGVWERAVGHGRVEAIREKS